MTEFIWVLDAVVFALHDEQLAEHGGLSGIRDMGAVQSALSRPRNLASYDGCDDIARLAAAYAFGIAKNHGFLDGNKRTAFVIAALFLQENGLRLSSPEGEAAVMTLALASGEIPEEGFAAWLRDRTEAI